jgi:mRNA interferase MazF
MGMSQLPERGDVVWINFTPQKGHEQAGHRPALVLSPKLYHEKSSLAVVCPITSNTQPWPWKVMLPEDFPVQGAILTDQLRSIDREARKLTIIHPAPERVLEEVLAKVGVLLSGGF